MFNENNYTTPLCTVVEFSGQGILCQSVRVSTEDFNELNKFDW